jgi:OOP family OmpA-OmpF porin
MRILSRSIAMKSIHFKPLAAAAGLAIGLLSLSAHAEGLYVGGSVGTPHFGSSIDGITGDGSGVSGKLFGGYQFSPNFGVEGGVLDMGRINNASGTVNGHGLYLDAMGLLPVGANWSLLGSVGVARVNLNTSNGDDNGVGLKLGLGAEYAVSRNVALRGEYENYRTAAFGGHPNIGQYTLGVRVGF